MMARSSAARPAGRGSPPRTYWQKFWIQLCLEIMSWLDADRQARARARLNRSRVEFR
jgi:hypothetical protein